MLLLGRVRGDGNLRIEKRGKSGRWRSKENLGGRREQ